MTILPPHQRRRRWHPWMTKTTFIIGGITVFLLAMAAYYYPKAKPVIDAARQAQSASKTLTQHISQQNFTAAGKDVADIQRQLTSVNQGLDRMKGLSHWPYIGKQYRAAVTLVSLAQDGTEAGSAFVDFLAHLFAPFADRGKVNLASLTADEKGRLLAGVSERESSLRTAQESIHRAAALLDKIPSKGLIGPLQKVVRPLKDNFPSILQAIDQAIPATHVLPPVLGYPKQKTYLFLMENNTELRPGGGFIGTYGLMKIRNGEITSLTTDNSYNLDEAAKNLPMIAPPDPIRRYLKVNNWNFRDANWSPDFPTSAQQALVLYEREGGVRDVDGVLALTPTAISAMLGLVGSIKIDNVEFTADNLTDKLQYYVDRGYASSGKDLSQRKDIIGAMTKELVDRLMRLPLGKWKDLFLVLSQQLSQKQFLMYMKDQALQSIIVDENWGGSIRDANNTDYLMVADANLASLKSDPAVLRTYDYRVTLNGDRPEATLTIAYNHTGKFGWKTTRYNTYVRIYVPVGTELIDSSGAQIREKSNQAGPVDTTTELGKTVFSAFKSIEPGTTSKLVLHYRLPASVSVKQSDQPYRLIWQKEPGMVDPQITLTVTSRPRPKLADGLDNEAKISKDAVTFAGSLNQDRDISISYK